MELDFTSPAFWLAVGQIVLIDILLGGDNAVVIALAVRKLDPSKRRQGIVWGTIGAIALRILLIVFALSLLSVPYLKVVGALLLLWIGVKLLLPEIPLVIFGLLVSVPIIIWGSQMVIRLMDRFPIVITIGGMLLGWIAGGMLITDPAVADHVSAWQPQIKYIAEVGGALLVLLIGTLSARRQKSKGA